MTREEFDLFIEKLGEISRKNPGLYDARVTGLVVLAYAFLVFVLLGSLILCAAMVVLVIYVPPTFLFALLGLATFGGIFLVVVRGLWVRLDPPEGKEVTRAQLPKLFGLLNDLRGTLNCKPFHKVLIMDDVNAAVMQIPRLGIFGWHRNYLLLGLPLMQSISPEEFKAVLAHEFAHSARGHGRFGNWLYRVRQTWPQIFEQMRRRQTRFDLVLFKFINWYWPIFNGHVFVLARVNEYEADSCSVRLVNADAMARALTRLQLSRALLVEKFWPEIFARAKHEPTPPDNVMLAVNQILKDGPTAADSARWMREALLAETNNQDTHPCLKDRLRAVNRLPATGEGAPFPPAPPPFDSQNAAEFFLGDQSESISRELSHLWQKTMTPKWRARHNNARKIAEDLAALGKPGGTATTAGQIWEKAKKIVELHGDGPAVTTLEQIVALEPKHAWANFILGRHLLQMDDSRGIEFIEKAIASDPDMAQNGFNLCHAYFRRTGQHEKLRPLENRFDEHQRRMALSERGRIEIFPTDVFIFHELSEEQIMALRKVFETEPDIRSAAIVKKEFAFDPDILCYAVGIKLTGWFKRRSKTENSELLERISIQLGLPGHVLVFLRNKDKELAANVFAVPGAVIYKRGA